MRYCFAWLPAVQEDAPQTVLGPCLCLARTFALGIDKNAPVRALRLSQITPILKCVGATQPAQQDRVAIAYERGPLARFRVPTFRVVEAVHLAVHAPDTERRRDTIRVAHLRRANPQQRLQNVQGFEIVAVT